MRRITALFVVIALCGLMVPGHSDGLVISVSPRVAVPVGDFGDLVGTGFGGAVAANKNVKGKPGRVGLVFLSFPEDLASATAFGAFAGYKYMVGSSDFRLFGKLDTTLYRISSELDLGAFGTFEEDETKIKLPPGIGIQKDAISVEIDYDLAGDWMGINLYYSLGG